MSPFKGVFVTPDWTGQDRIQSQFGVWKVKMGGGQLCPVDHFIPNEGDKSDPSGDWVTFVPPSSLQSISGRPLRSIVDLASPSPSKHLADCAIILDAIRGKDPDDLSSKDISLDDPFSIDITKLSVGYLDDADMEVVHVLASKGVKMVPFELKYAVDSVQGIVNFTMDVDMLAHFDEWQRLGQDDDYESQDQWPTELRRARVFPAVDYVQRPPVDDLGLNDSIPNPPTVTYPPRLLHL
ncbi:hypothetical protein FEM48_Zijuj09G0108300 [Ziziphus jujuba var. spinosa]|uniref:Uncharacterized protein n=1 Tax=Ziziphus jujuba var. spinosa TaxID=714518 RepID=A0A978USK4_ZIZJJ|nr:hypothetical protein FEM48_Zijuj09G0108300 [Ziziphus jujuba var. spinosa]